MAIRRKLIYADGSCYWADDAGGWAACIIDVDEPHLIDAVRGSSDGMSNNRAEMMAVIVALEALPDACAVEVRSDSQYVIHGMSKKPRPRRNANLDLWSRLDAATERIVRVEWTWVRGHSGDLLNEVCDEFAGKERIEFVRRRMAKGCGETGRLMSATEDGGQLEFQP